MNKSAIWFGCALATAVLVTACGGDGDDDNNDVVVTFDARVGASDSAGVVETVEIACPVTPDAVVTTQNSAYVPMMTSIVEGDIVQFTPEGIHDVNGGAVFSVGFGGNKCFRFDVAGSYPFHCTSHPFTGTITVAAP